MGRGCRTHTATLFIYWTYRTVSTIDTSEEVKPEEVAEFRRSLLVYCFARTKEIHKLGLMAKKRAQDLGDNLSIIDFLATVREVYPKLPSDDVWILEFLRYRVEYEKQRDARVFIKSSVYDLIGETASFDCALVEIIVKIADEPAPAILRQNKKDVSVSDESCGVLATPSYQSDYDSALPPHEIPTDKIPAVTDICPLRSHHLMGPERKWLECLSCQDEMAEYARKIVPIRVSCREDYAPGWVNVVPRR
ncbi:hypothetical protein FQN57_004807 [Myotisia sp. PD_48]|nr:hypothetical protein FQN57_004807 [Myotisia sp. PD_48]